MDSTSKPKLSDDINSEPDVNPLLDNKIEFKSNLNLLDRWKRMIQKIKLNKDDIDSNPLGVQEDAKNERYKKNTSHRGRLIAWSAFIVTLWLVGVWVLLYLVGLHNDFRISDSVLITLLTTTTINVLGLMIIVLKDLFNDNSGN